MYIFDCYKEFALESCPNCGGSNADVRVRPLAGQGVPTSMRVECSRDMREELTATTVAILRCKVITREGGTPFLYSYFSNPYKLVSRKKAQAMIKRGELGFPEK